MKKALIGIGLVFGALSLMSYKKVNSITNIVDQLSYKLKTIKNLNLSGILQGVIKFKVDIYITNTTSENLDISRVKINSVKFYLKQTNQLFAESTSLIQNIAIPAQSTIELNDIDVAVKLNMVSKIFNLVTTSNINNLKDLIKIEPDIEIFGVNL